MCDALSLGFFQGTHIKIIGVFRVKRFKTMILLIYK